jgi:hypothetical protein
MADIRDGLDGGVSRIMRRQRGRPSVFRAATVREVFSDDAHHSKAARSSVATIFAVALVLMGVSVTPFDARAGEVDPKSLLKATSDYLAAQKSISFGYDTNFEVVTKCDHLAFRTKDLDWQMWIAHGDRPYPCRYVITSKQVDQAPQYSIQIRDWKSGPEVSAGDYRFANATNAKKIDLKDLTELVELPNHFVIGGGQ